MNIEDKCNKYNIMLLNFTEHSPKGMKFLKEDNFLTMTQF